METKTKSFNEVTVGDILYYGYLDCCCETIFSTIVYQTEIANMDELPQSLPDIKFKTTELPDFVITKHIRPTVAVIQTKTGSAYVGVTKKDVIRAMVSEIDCHLNKWNNRKKRILANL